MEAGTENKRTVNTRLLTRAAPNAGRSSDAAVEGLGPSNSHGGGGGPGTKHITCNPKQQHRGLSTIHLVRTEQHFRLTQMSRECVLNRHRSSYILRNGEFFKDLILQIRRNHPPIRVEKATSCVRQSMLKKKHEQNLIHNPRILNLQ